MIFSHPSDFQKHCAKDLFSVAALEILVSTPRALHHCKLHWTALTILSVNAGKERPQMVKGPPEAPYVVKRAGQPLQSQLDIHVCNLLHLLQIKKPVEDLW